MKTIIPKSEQDYFFAKGEAKGFAEGYAKSFAESKAQVFNMVNKVNNYLKSKGRQKELLEHSDVAAFIQKIYQEEIDKA